MSTGSDRPRPLRHLLAATLLLLVSASCTVRDPRGEAIRRFEEAARGAVAASLAISVDGRLVLTHHLGFEDPEAGVSASDATRYRVYSLLKPVTAVAALRLMADGGLDADAPIARYLPDYPRPAVAAAVTARMLATHRAGIRHYRDAAEARGDRHCRDTTEAVAIFADDPLVAEPGTAVNYSTWGFVLLSHVLAAAAGEPFDALLRRLVLAPAGMDATVHADPNASIARRAKGFRLEAGVPVAVRDLDPSCKWGGGGYLATVGDLARFATALYDARGPVDEAARELIFRGEPTYAATAWNEGGMGYLVADRERRVAVVILTNTLDRELGERLVAARDAIARRLAQRLTPGPEVPPEG